MAEFATIARPYAKAFYELSVKYDKLESWQSGLRDAAWLLNQKKVIAVIDGVDTDAEEKARFLTKMLQDSEAVQNPVFRNFIAVVAAEKRLRVLPEIYNQFLQLAAACKNSKQAVVYSAFELASEGQKAKIVKDLEQHFGTCLDVVFRIDPNLIGGVKVEMGDQVLDLSVQGKLQNLYAAMIS